MNCPQCGEPAHDSQDDEAPDCCRDLCHECLLEHMDDYTARELVLERVTATDPDITPEERIGNLHYYLTNLRARRRYWGRAAQIRATQAEIALLAREHMADLFGRE